MSSLRQRRVSHATRAAVKRDAAAAIDAADNGSTRAARSSTTPNPDQSPHNFFDTEISESESELDDEADDSESGGDSDSDDDDDITTAAYLNALSPDERRDRVRRARRLTLKSGSANIHAVSDVSPLDTSAQKQNFNGFINLGKIIFFASNIRLLVENILKYGVLLALPSSEHFVWERSWPILCYLLVLPVLAYVSSLVEQASMATPQPHISHATTCWVQSTIAFVCFFGCVAVIHVTTSAIIPGVVVLFASIVMTMKLISYAHVMSSDRQRLLRARANGIVVEIGSAKRKAAAAAADKLQSKSGKIKHKKSSRGRDERKSTSKKRSLKLPNSIATVGGRASALTARLESARRSIRSMTPSEIESELPTLDTIDTSFTCLLYFIAAPTLCYQHVYPRTPRIRRRFLSKRVMELLFCLGLMIIFSQQYIEPTLKNARKYMSDDHVGRWNFLGLLERVLKLSIPNLVVWLLMFYSLFHAWLNICAELLRFGDRVFYRDWWNARTLKDYWNRWNIPVHNWVLRHLYAPCMRNGLSNVQAQAIVFFVSAVLHEVLISVPAHIVKLHAFIGMMVQIPLIVLTEWMKNRFADGSQWGNVVFWCTFCVFGQPLIILIYYSEFVGSLTAETVSVLA